MRIVLFHPEFRAVGGAEILLASQGAWMRDQGHDVGLVTFGLDPDRWTSRLDGLPVTVVPKRTWTEIFAIERPVPKILMRARRAARAFQGADVVVAGNYPCSTMLATRRTAARRVWYCCEPNRQVHVREANPVLTAHAEGEGARSPARAVEAFTAKLAERDGRSLRSTTLRRVAEFDRSAVPALDDIVAISAFTRENVRRIYGRCAEEIVPPLVRFPEEVRHRSGLDRSGLQVLVHTRLEVVKNVDTVIRGFARFRERGCPGARMHVVGEGDGRPALEALVAELGIADAVRFHGFLSEAELQRVRDACDVLAVLPIDEPFGMIFPEAAARGLLLVGPDHGGPSEILDGGALGWTCDAFDPEALADALARVWATPDAEADRRRVETDRACRDRYSLQVVGPALLRALC